MSRTDKLRFALIAISVIAVVVVAALTGCSVKDSTDPPDGVSGLIPYTDALTGCQYLARSYGGALTPRMGADGKQICGKDTHHDR